MRCPNDKLRMDYYFRTGEYVCTMCGTKISPSTEGPAWRIKSLKQLFLIRRPREVRKRVKA